jgi:hypothetical protein
LVAASPAETMIKALRCDNDNDNDNDNDERGYRNIGSVGLGW